MENDWKKVEEKKLRKLYYDNEMTDNEIATMYNVTVTKVRYKRNKYGISIKNQVKEEFANQNEHLFSILNAESRKRLLSVDKIDIIAKALTYYLFRDGPIEDMHSNEQLSQDDMKTLNKFMVNKLAGMLLTIINGEWLKVELLVDYYKTVGREWDKPEPDVEILDALFERACQK